MKDYPLIKYVIAFIVGIITTPYLELSFAYSLLIIFILLLFTLVTHFTK